MTLPIQFLQLAGQLFSDFAIEWFEPIIFAFYGHRNRPLTLDPFWLPLFSQMDGFDTVNWPHILRDISIYYNVESLLGYLMVKILLLLYCDTWSYLMTKLYNTRNYLLPIWYIYLYLPNR